MTSRSEPARAFEHERRASASAGDDTSIARLLGELIGDAQALMRREIDLAREEVSHEVGKVKQSAVALGAGVGLATVGGILLGHTLALLLQSLFGLAPWLAYLIVGALLAVAGALAIQQGLARMREVDPVPRETIESMRKDVAWIAEQNPSDKI